MPICKNCHARIDKFDKDRCPLCGVENPFEGVSSETVEITTAIDVENKDYHPCKRKTVLLLFIALGFFGVPFFYMKQKKPALIYAFFNLLGIGLIGFVLGFYGHMPYWLTYLIAVGIFELVNIGFGLYLYFLPNIKDGNGDFLV